VTDDLGELRLEEVGVGEEDVEELLGDRRVLGGRHGWG